MPPRAHRGRRGVPGEPVPGPFRAAARPGTGGRRRSHGVTGPGQPGAVRRHGPPSGARCGDRHGLARALPPPRRPYGGLGPHQGHRPDRRGPSGEGPRRERHDRRPGPQRPGTCVRHRLGDRTRPVRRREVPRPGAPGVHRARRTRRPRRMAGAARGNLPAPLRHGAPPSPVRCASSRRWRPRRAARTAVRSARSMPTAPRLNSPSVSARSGSTALLSAARHCASVPGRGSPGVPTPSASGPRRS